MLEKSVVVTLPIKKGASTIKAVLMMADKMTKNNRSRWAFKYPSKRLHTSVFFMLECFLSKLDFCNFPIEWAGVQKLLVRTGSNNLSIVHHKDTVCIYNRTDTLRH